MARKIDQNDIEDRAILPRHLQAAGNGGVGVTPGTTTTTGSFVALLGPFDVPLPISRLFIDVTVNIAIKHSVADALFGFQGVLYDAGLVHSLVVFSATSILLPRLAANWAFFSLAGCGYTDAGGLLPGLGKFFVYGFNNQAGTLTFGQGGGAEFFSYETVGH